MAEERMAVLDTVRKAIAEGDQDFLRLPSHPTHPGAGRSGATEILCPSIVSSPTGRAERPTLGRRVERTVQAECTMP